MKSTDLWTDIGSHLGVLNLEGLRRRQGDEALFEAILAPLEGHETVLVVGAGRGSLTLEIASHLDTGVVYAIDRSRDRLRRLELRAYRVGLSRRVRTIAGDSAETRLADGSVDLVVSFGMLHQVQKTEPVLAEAFRVLKPGGRLVVEDLADSLGGRLRGLMCLKMAHDKHDRGPLGRRLEAVGFTSISPRRRGRAFVIALASKPESTSTQAPEVLLAG